jgi:hypothetical protein
LTELDERTNERKGDNMTQEEKLTLMQALRRAGAPDDALNSESKLYLGLVKAIARDRIRFAAVKDGGRLLVDPVAVGVWYGAYRPRHPRPARAQLILYLRDQANKPILTRLARQVGRPSISAALNDWAEGSLEMIERNEEQHGTH